ncbi:MAG TPA: diacylglycerol kinase family protein, partial [Candidatus Binatia bacterium]|nr:diacylglycerol kinase family protein [Candidatus Binatia bacterium]
MKVAVLVNASAGSARSLSPGELERLFRDANISADIVTVRENDFEKVLQQALRQPPDAIIGGGGDGTLSTIAAKLAGTGIPLGVLPLGTCNHFAKDLGIPMDLEEAVNCIGRCSAEPVDMGEVNGHLFINNSSIGAYPEIVREREDQRARLG